MYEYHTCFLFPRQNIKYIGTHNKKYKYVFYNIISTLYQINDFNIILNDR